MLYKPKFCCQCGVPIERTDWTILTSRRFCDLCATDYKFDDLIPKVIIGILILFGIFGFGAFLRKPEKPLNLSSANQTNTNKNSVNTQVLPDANGQTFTKIQETNSNISQSPSKSIIAAPSQNLKTQKVENQSNATEETIYFCGAETKKGTFCTRRVKGGGRCWQHIGKPAMLPQEKLIASR